MVSGGREPQAHVHLLSVLTSLRSPLPRIDCSACGHSSKEASDEMTQGHRHIRESQARPLLRVSKSTCRLVDLRQLRGSLCSEYCLEPFCWKGTSPRLTHRYVRVSLGVSVTAFLEYRERQERSSLRVLRIWGLLHLCADAI